MYYFAYGSNMPLARTRQPNRVPTARFVTTARLPGHTLRFHKRSRDGSAKCNVFETGYPEEVIYGVLLEIDRDGKKALDRVEGLGKGYHEKKVCVTVGDGELSACTYVADAHHTDDSLRPYTWYRDLVVAGAKQHALPPRYANRIQATEAVEDPDPQRAIRKRRLLDAGRD